MGRVLLLSILAGFLGGIIAWHKGRNVFVWFAICFLLPLAVVVVGFLPPVAAPGLTKACPKCVGIMAQDAVHCAACGHDLPIEMKQCPSCGRVVRDGAYCGACGKPLR